MKPIFVYKHHEISGLFVPIRKARRVSLALSIHGQYHHSPHATRDVQSCVSSSLKQIEQYSSAVTFGILALRPSDRPLRTSSDDAELEHEHYEETRNS